MYDAPVSEPHIRKVRPDELEEVWRVHVASSSDLLVRRGRPATRPADAPVASDARAGLASDPDGYFCAVEEGQIRGMISAAAGVGGGGSVTMRVPGACASLLEALVSCGFRIGDPTLFMASRLFGRPELYLPSGPILY